MRFNTFSLFFSVLLLLGVTLAINAATHRSSRWESVRVAFIKANPTCAACGHKATQVHHIQPFHLHPELELDPANLISLCDRDHLLFGHLGNFESYNVNVRADCAWMLAKIKARPSGVVDDENDTSETAAKPDVWRQSLQPVEAK